jgi:hypothetical protein
MTHIKIVIDDQVEFDGSVSEWKRTPPDLFKDVINPNATPAPHMKAIMVAMADAVMLQRSTNITSTTDVDEWTVKVRYR